MDENKLETLREIQYKIKKVCGNCMFSQLNGDWGICLLHSYSHKKHSEPNSALSINIFGSCSEWEFKADSILGGYTEFLNG